MNRSELAPLLSLVRYLSSELDPQMTLLNLNAFLTTAVDEEVASIADLRDALGNFGGTRSNTSRNIAYWTEESWRRPDGTRPDGFNFVKTTMDPEDYRRKLLQLTPEGESFCKRLEEMLSTDKEDTSMENEHAQDESEELFALRDSIRGEFSVTQEGHLFIVSASAEDFTGSITCLSFGEAKRVAHCLKIACEMPYYNE